MAIPYGQIAFNPGQMHIITNVYSMTFKIQFLTTITANIIWKKNKFSIPTELVKYKFYSNKHPCMLRIGACIQ